MFKLCILSCFHILSMNTVINKTTKNPKLFLVKPIFHFSFDRQGNQTAHCRQWGPFIGHRLLVQVAARIGHLSFSALSVCIHSYLWIYFISSNEETVLSAITTLMFLTTPQTQNGELHNLCSKAFGRFRALLLQRTVSCRT